MKKILIILIAFLLFIPLANADKCNGFGCNTNNTRSSYSDVGTNNSLFKIDNAEIVWTTGNGFYGATTDETGNTYIFTDSGYLYKIAPNGTIVQSIFIDTVNDIQTQPSLDSENNIYVAFRNTSVVTTKRNLLVKINNNFSKAWTYTRNTENYWMKKIAIDTNGNSYISVHNFWLFAIDNEGNELFRIDETTVTGGLTGTNGLSNPILLNDGVVIFKTNSPTIVPCISILTERIKYNKITGEIINSDISSMGNPCGTVHNLNFIVDNSKIYGTFEYGNGTDYEFLECFNNNLTSCGYSEPYGKLTNDYIGATNGIFYGFEDPIYSGNTNTRLFAVFLDNLSVKYATNNIPIDYMTQFAIDANNIIYYTNNSKFSRIYGNNGTFIGSEDVGLGSGFYGDTTIANNTIYSYDAYNGLIAYYGIPEASYLYSGNVRFYYNSSNYPISTCSVVYNSTINTTCVNGAWNLPLYENIGTIHIQISNGTAYDSGQFSITPNLAENQYLYYSTPLMSMPNVSGKNIFSKYSNLADISLNLWATPSFVWGKYQMKEKTYFKPCVYQGNNQFMCDKYQTTENYLFSVVYSDVYNNYTNPYNPAVYENRTFETTKIMISNDMNLLNPIDGKTQLQKEEYLQDNYYDVITIMIIFILIIFFTNYTNYTKRR